MGLHVHVRYSGDDDTRMHKLLRIETKRCLIVYLEHKNKKIINIYMFY